MKGEDTERQNDMATVAVARHRCRERQDLIAWASMATERSLPRSRSDTIRTHAHSLAQDSELQVV